MALAWPWAVLKVLGLCLEVSGLGLMTCGLINITECMIAAIVKINALHATLIRFPIKALFDSIVFF